MKNKEVIIIGLVLVFIVIFLAIFMGDKSLDLESEEIANLYSYLGEVDVYHCGGLNQYTKGEVTYNDISNDNKLCIAFYELDASVIQKASAEVTGVNDNDISICTVGEGTRLTADEEEDTCSYSTIALADLKDAYQKVYGKDLPEDEVFYINSTQACYPEEDIYYCGEAETFTYSLTPEATVYRLMSKAVEKINGDIVISDYYLRISGNKCYSSNSAEDEVTACSAAIEENPDLEITKEFVQEYGGLYEHTFTQDDTQNYYWYSSRSR